MKTILSAAMILLAAASPALAQATGNGAADDCVAGIGGTGGSPFIQIGVGGPVFDYPCRIMKGTNLAGLIGANAHLMADPQCQASAECAATVRWWFGMAREQYCANPVVRDNDPQGLCKNHDAVAATPSAVVVSAHPFLLSTGLAIPETPKPAAAAPPASHPPIVAALTVSSQPWYKSCPPGVPVSQCSVR